MIESAFLDLCPAHPSFHMYSNSPDVSKREQRTCAKVCFKRKVCIFRPIQLSVRGFGEWEH